MIVKTGNPTATAVTCKVICVFDAPEGPVTVSCAQEVPASATDWYVCMRPTGSKALTFRSGSEECR